MSDERIRELAGLMFEELSSTRLEVIVVPDGRENSHRGVRCVVSSNPDWYSRLCDQYKKKSKEVASSPHDHQAPARPCSLESNCEAGSPA